jgi:hypothetical protein
MQPSWQPCSGSEMQAVRRRAGQALETLVGQSHSIAGVFPWSSGKCWSARDRGAYPAPLLVSRRVCECWLTESSLRRSGRLVAAVPSVAIGGRGWRPGQEVDTRCHEHDCKWHASCSVTGVQHPAALNRAEWLQHGHAARDVGVSVGGHCSFYPQLPAKDQVPGATARRLLSWATVAKTIPTPPIPVIKNDFVCI